MPISFLSDFFYQVVGVEVSRGILEFLLRGC